MRAQTIATSVALAGLLSCPAIAQTSPQPSVQPNPQANPPKPAESAAPTTVVVKAQTPPVVHKIDRTVYNLDGNILATTGSVADVLATLPSVYVDPRGNISVHGAGVQIYVDGKPAPQFRGANLTTALQAMPANTVARIEIITNPGAEFRANAGIVINIVTKTASGHATTGEVILSAGSDARYNQTLLGSMTSGKWVFNGSVAMQQNRWAYTEQAQRVSLDGNGNPLSRLVENEAASRHMDNAAVDGTATYNATDHDSLALNLDVTTRYAERRMNDAFAISDPATVAPVDTDTLVQGPNHYNTQSVTATYKHKDPVNGDITLQARHEEDDSLYDFIYDQLDLVPVAPDVMTRRAGSVRTLTDGLTGDYVRILATDTEFKSGFDIESARQQDNNLGTTIDDVTGAETIAPDFTDRFLSDERLEAAYVQYQQPFGKWLIQGGLRVENMLTRLTDARPDGYDQISDTFVSPSLFIGRNLTPDSKIKFSYSRHISRPATGWYDPHPITLDANDVEEGNPDLKPSSEDSFEANYNYTTKPLTVDVTAYYRDTAHAITPYSYAQGPGSSVIVWSYENAGRSQRSGVDLDLDMHPSKTIGLNLSSELFGTALDSPLGGGYFRQSISSYFAKGALTWQPKPADNLQLVYQTWGRGLIAGGTSSSGKSLNLAYSHKLNEKLKLVATATNILNSSRWSQVQQTPQFDEAQRGFFPGAYLMLGLDYKFGAGK